MSKAVDEDQSGYFRNSELHLGLHIMVGCAVGVRGMVEFRGGQFLVQTGQIRSMWKLLVSLRRTDLHSTNKLVFQQADTQGKHPPFC